MAGEEIVMQNMTGELAEGVSNALSNIPGMSTIIQISKAVGIVIIIYIIVLILRALIDMKQALRFKKLAKNVEEINQKMDILTGKKGKKK